MEVYSQEIIAENHPPQGLFPVSKTQLIETLFLEFKDVLFSCEDEYAAWHSYNTRVILRFLPYRWATLQNLNDTFRRFSERMNHHLRETAEVTRIVVEKTLQKRKENDIAVSEELTQKRQLANRLQRLTLISQTHDSTRKGLCHANED